MITVVIKGPAKNAKRAAQRAGVTVHSCKTLHRFGEVRCEVPCGQLTKTMNWFGEKVSSKTGRGSLPGTLLHFSQHGCSTSELRGSKTKRRSKAQKKRAKSKQSRKAK